jgi:hypothetical protein
MNNDPAFLSSSPLVWTQTKPLGRSYDLRSGDSLVGHLRFDNPCGSLACAEVRSENWTFKRVGFLAPRITVRAGNSAVDLAVFRPYWGGGGTVDVVGRGQFLWKCVNFWRSKWAFVRTDNSPILQFSHQGVFSNASAKLEVEPSCLDFPELFLLVALGWYLMILAAEDAAAIMVVAGS